jgi:hypothetical protein
VCEGFKIQICQHFFFSELGKTMGWLMLELWIIKKALQFGKAFFNGMDNKFI